MTGRKTVLLCGVVALLLCSASCSKDDGLRNTLSQQTRDNGCKEEMLVLGKEIVDPYCLTVMQKAFETMNQAKAPISKITPNHKYVRILPENDEELNLLQRDTNLLLWSYPLNYEIEVAGTCYHDPSIPADKPTWQYCVVPIEYEFPAGLNIEEIYEVYIPESGKGKGFYDELEDKALEIAGVERATKAAEWTPSATLRTYDDIVGGHVPLEGIVVRARYGTKIAKGTTNSSGYCRLDKSFKQQVNYSFKWERAYWDIRNGVIGQAFYNGPKLGTAWDLSINRTSGKSILFATVHRAAMKFYYGNCLGVHRPILADSKTKIAVKDENASWGSGCCWGTWSHQGVIPDIIIANPNFVPPSFVFNITIHELAHQSHLLFMNLGTYIQLGKEIHESWAEAVAHILTNHHYNHDLKSYGERCRLFDGSRSLQEWHPKTLTGGKTSCYTPIFYDLIDTMNQRHGGTFGCSQYNYNSASYLNEDLLHLYNEDPITGYSLKFIQDNILQTSYGLSSFYSSIKRNKINGITDSIIDVYISPYWGQDYKRP